MESTITIKGQATIPKAVRDHLHVKPGDRIKFFIHPDGTVVMLPKIPITALKGIVKSRRKAAVTLEEMDEAIAAGIIDRNRRASVKSR
jgi:AbrB family looped-hinge helix DNA binding protein